MRYLSDEWLENDDPADISDYAPREPGYISIIDDWDEDISTGLGPDGVVGYWD